MRYGSSFAGSEAKVSGLELTLRLDTDVVRVKNMSVDVKIEITARGRVRRPRDPQ